MRFCYGYAAPSAPRQFVCQVHSRYPAAGHCTHRAAGHRAAKPYVESKKLLNQQENFSHFDEIAAQYDIAKENVAIAEKEEAEAEAKRIAEEKAELERRKAEKAEKKAAKKNK